MYIVRIQSIMQTLKAGLVLYLHSKKKENKWLQIHYYYIFVV